MSKPDRAKYLVHHIGSPQHQTCLVLMIRSLIEFVFCQVTTFNQEINFRSIENRDERGIPDILSGCLVSDDDYDQAKQYRKRALVVGINYSPVCKDVTHLHACETDAEHMQTYRHVFAVRRSDFHLSSLVYFYGSEWRQAVQTPF